AAANNATVDLTSGAGITEGAAKITTGGALGMSAAEIGRASCRERDVATVAASTSSSTLTYQEANALTVGTVAAAGNFPGATGVSTAGAAITIERMTGGQISVSNDIAAANNATVDLTSGAGITEGAAKITTGGALGMSAAGTINRSEERRVGEERRASRRPGRHT